MANALKSRLASLSCLDVFVATEVVALSVIALCSLHASFVVGEGNLLNVTRPVDGTSIRSSESQKWRVFRSDDRG